MDNQTALSSLRDSEARLQSALEHVQAAIKVLRPATVLPTPVQHSGMIATKENYDREVKVLDKMQRSIDDLRGIPRRKIRRKAKRGSAAFRRHCSEAQKAVWASLSPAEREERIQRMQAGRRAK